MPYSRIVYVYLSHYSFNITSPLWGKLVRRHWFFSPIKINFWCSILLISFIFKFFFALSENVQNPLLALGPYLTHVLIHTYHSAKNSQSLWSLFNAPVILQGCCYFTMMTKEMFVLALHTFFYLSSLSPICLPNIEKSSWHKPSSKLCQQSI